MGNFKYQFILLGIVLAIEAGYFIVSMIIKREQKKIATPEGSAQDG
jgi:hypothetical protein